MTDQMSPPLDVDDILSKINYLHAMLHVFLYSFNSKIHLQLLDIQDIKTATFITASLLIKTNQKYYYIIGLSIVLPYLQTKSFLKKTTMISRFVKIVSNQCLVFRLFKSITIVKKREEDGELKLIFIDTRNVLKKKETSQLEFSGLG